MEWKTYQLVNYGTGEVYTVESLTAQYLYNRACSIRRENIRYNMPQDNIKLFIGDRIIAEWKGKLETPIEDLGINLPIYYCLKRRGLSTIGQVIQYAYTKDIDRRLSDKRQYELAKILMIYDKNAACKLIRKLNDRKFKKLKGGFRNDN